MPTKFLETSKVHSFIPRVAEFCIASRMSIDTVYQTLGATQLFKGSTNRETGPNSGAIAQLTKVFGPYTTI